MAQIAITATVNTQSFVFTPRLPIAARRARDLDRSANAAAPFSEDDDGATRKEIGNLLRLDVVRVESREVHVDAGEYRRVDVAAESRRRLLRLVGSVHDERFPKTCTRDAFHEVSVHAAADA